MNILLDSNIILHIVRSNKGLELLKYINPENNLVFVSFVSVAEVQSIAFRNNWGFNKMQRLEEFFSNLTIIDVSDILLNTYIQIDAYSQRNHPDYELYPFKTPRNMGKNDLWIASTASLLNFKLVTTDNDFNHLENIFLSIIKITPEEISTIFKA